MGSNPTGVTTMIPNMTPVLLVPGSGLESDLNKLWELDLAKIHVNKFKLNFIHFFMLIKFEFLLDQHCKGHIVTFPTVTGRGRPGMHLRVLLHA